MAIAPAVATGLSLALGVGQMAMGVAGSLIGAASEAEAARKAEEVALRNKAIAEENAQRTLILAQEEQYDVDMETAALLGEQEAIQAGSGLRLDSGSYIQTRRTARELGRIDALNVQEAARIRAQAYRTEGDSYAAEADAARRAEGNARLSGFLGAANSIIGGASSLVRIAPTRTNGRMTVPAATRL